METVERIKAEVERLRDTKGITFNEMVCYANVLRIIERECKDRLLEGGQWGDLMSKPKYRIDLGRIDTNE
jgi:hypothetical protein